MSFLPIDQLTELQRFAAIADKEARSDLMRGYIKDENDYTSNFTGALRRIINSNSLTGLTATSFLLQPHEERECGADASIIITRGSESKVAVFEAKWPRFYDQGYSWDYAQTSTGLSHFSDQLERQKRWNGSFAVFEMFYSEYPFGTKEPFLVPLGSSCVWHRDTEAFRQARSCPNAIWTQAELQKLLSANRVEIADILLSLGLCAEGKLLSMTEPEGIAREFRLPTRLLAIAAAKDRPE